MVWTFSPVALAELSHFRRQTVVLSLQPDPLVGAIGGATPTVGHGILSPSDDVEDRGFNVGVPALGERDLRGLALTGHVDLERIVVSSAAFKISMTSVSSEGYDTWQDNLEIAGLPHHTGLIRLSLSLRTVRMDRSPR